MTPQQQCSAATALTQNDKELAKAKEYMVLEHCKTFGNTLESAVKQLATACDDLGVMKP